MPTLWKQRVPWQQSVRGFKNEDPAIFRVWWEEGDRQPRKSLCISKLSAFPSSMYLPHLPVVCTIPRIFLQSFNLWREKRSWTLHRLTLLLESWDFYNYHWREFGEAGGFFFFFFCKLGCRTFKNKTFYLNISTLVHNCSAGKRSTSVVGETLNLQGSNWSVCTEGGKWR